MIYLYSIIEGLFFTDFFSHSPEIIDDEIVVTDDDEIEIERFINFEIED